MKKQQKGSVFITVRMLDGRTAQWRLPRSGLNSAADLVWQLELTPERGNKNKHYDGHLSAEPVLFSRERFESMMNVLVTLARAEEHANDHALYSWNSKTQKFVSIRKKSHTWGPQSWKKK